MSANNIDLNDVMAVDGGLRYILSRYPQADGCDTDPRKGFKIRDTEKHASAKLKQLPDGKWGVTDFGGDGKMKDAIHIAMSEDGIDFVTALKAVAAFYEIGGAKVELPRPDYNSWPAKPDEQDGKTTYQTKELTTEEIKHVLVDAAWSALHKEEAKRLGLAQNLFAYYHLKSVKWKRFTNKGITHEFTSNDRYPIFIYEEGTETDRWGRFYEPKADKKDRFRYLGEKPRVFIHGLSQAHAKFEELSKGSGKDYDKMTDAEKKEERREKKLPAIINCSGGSDALNTAALGYQVVWRNSESEEWTEYQYSELRKICDFFYNLPDIDVTGIIQGHKMALQFLDMRTIWLPERMLEARDNEGKPYYKDLRDYLRFQKENLKGTYRKRDFELLVNTALPYEFWDVDYLRNKDGDIKMKFGRMMLEYKPNNLRIYNFLYRMGYHRLKSDKTKDGFVYVHVHNNIVREIEASELKDFLHTFLASRDSLEDLRNAFFRSPQLSDSSLSNIPVRELDFKAYGADYQYLFFNNVTWKITGNGIQELAPGATGKYVWDDKILKIETLVNGKVKEHKAKKEDDYFKFTKLANGDWQADILKTDCQFLNFLIQTCRVHWREELEERLDFYENYDTAEKQEKYRNNHALGADQLAAIEKHSKDETSKAAYRAANHVNIAGELLTKAEKAEQQAHLANRIYVIGYALHRWKVSSRPWAVWGMDSKLSEEGESHGGSGKSLITRFIKLFSRVVPLPGRSEKMTENAFMFENVTRESDLILVDDTHQHLDFGPFFEPLTSDMVVNRKNVKSIIISFKDSPKFWFNSNYGDKHTDPSSQRRKMYTVYSDYYHKNANGNYRSDWSPKDDFGLDLLDDFDQVQQNYAYNLGAQCLKFYLACEDAVRAPSENVSKRNLMAKMGDNFKSWADVYFSNEAKRLDVKTPRDEAQDSFFKTSVKMSPQSFLGKLKAWCQLYGFILNPVDMSNDNRRIIVNVDGKSTEMFYIDTSGLTGLPKVETPKPSPVMPVPEQKELFPGEGGGDEEDMTF